MENSFSIDEKINILYECITEDGGIVDLGWCSYLLYPYYNYFDDKNSKYRAGSLIAFWGLLLEWEDGSGFPFYTGTEDYLCHDFKKYMESFMRYSLKIKFDYPNIYSHIIESLDHLYKEENLEDTFPNIDKDFIGKIRKMLLIEYKPTNPNSYKDAYKEAGILV